jgi:hypothetical protein
MDPRKRKRRTPVAVNQGTALVRTQVDYSAVDPQGFAYCRMLAGEVYVHSELAVTVRELNKRPEFLHLRYELLEDWCARDGWVERRKALQEAVRKRVEASIATDLAQARIEQLRQLLAIREKFNGVGMSKNAKGEITFNLEPKSLEGWMSVLLKLDAHIDKLQGAVASILPSQTASAVVPMGGGSGLSPTLRPRLTEEESLELALKLRDMRIVQDNNEVAKFQAEQRAVEEAQAATGTVEPTKPARKRKPPT